MRSHVIMLQTLISCLKDFAYLLSLTVFLPSSSLHCFEGLEWLHLKRGREQFARGLVVKVDPQGRCGGVLIYDLQMIILKATQVYPLCLANLKFFVVYHTTYFLFNLVTKKNH